MAKITVQNTNISVINLNGGDYVSIRNRHTGEYLGIWESLYNPHFNPLEFEGVRKEAGLNTFTLSPNMPYLLSKV